MSAFRDPFDPEAKVGCRCGGHASEAEHDAHASAQLDSDALGDRSVETAVMRALFPHEPTRRRFLSAVGRTTALAAVSSLFPLAAAKEAFAQKTAIEKPNLKVGFIPITCATPIIMSQPMGFYGRQGLNVDVVKTAGWAVIRDKTINKEYDAAHMLSPMPLAITLGVGATPIPYTMPAVENINGQAITLAMKHKDKRDPKQWKGFKFAVPFDYSMHNYLLRYFVAEHGLDPDRDIQIRAVPPPEMVANLRADNIDGFLAPDPVNQRAVYDGVGFIHILTKEIWEGHPVLRVRGEQGVRHAIPGHLSRAAESDRRCDRVRGEGGEPQADRGSHRAGELSQSAGDGRRAGADGHLRRWARQRSQRAEPHRFRSVPIPVVRCVDPHADEALGPVEERRRLREGRARGVSRDRRREAHEGSGHEAAGGAEQEVRRHGQGVRSRRSPTPIWRASRSSGRRDDEAP